MKANAKRSKKVTVTKEVEIISHRHCCIIRDEPGGGANWITLKRKCVLCGKKFVMGDDVSLCLYSEDGEQYSGGLHTACLPEGESKAQ